MVGTMYYPSYVISLSIGRYWYHIQDSHLTFGNIGLGIEAKPVP